MDTKRVMGSKFPTEEFRNVVMLNGEGCFISKKNRPADGRTPPGCFTMHVNEEALQLLTSHGAHMLADGKLYPREPGNS